MSVSQGVLLVADKSTSRDTVQNVRARLLIVLTNFAVLLSLICDLPT